MLNIINKTKYNDLKEYYPLLEEYYRKTLKTLVITSFRWSSADPSVSGRSTGSIAESMR